MPNDEQTYYEILGVSQDATLREIKTAYRQKAMECHPDVNPEANSRECHLKMCKINEAFRVLRNINSRLEYDKSLKKNEKSQNSSSQKENSSKSATEQKSDVQSGNKVSYDVYDYYNTNDFEESEQEEFIEWLKDFAPSYINYVKNYYKKLNKDASELIDNFYTYFILIINYEKNFSRTRIKLNNN